MSTIGPRSEHDDGEELNDDDAPDWLILDTTSSRKFVPQLRYSMLKWAVCDLETGVHWWLQKNVSQDGINHNRYYTNTETRNLACTTNKFSSRTKNTRSVRPTYYLTGQNHPNHLQVGVNRHFHLSQLSFTAHRWLWCRAID